MKLLVVEDNISLRQNIVDYLSKEGHVCEAVSTYNEALRKIVSFKYDIVILDIMLPDGSGLDGLNILKEEYPLTGVLIISAKDSLEDRITGLDLGADDYLAKPFHLSELNARVNAIYRRRHQQGSPKIEFEEITIDPDTHEAFVRGKYFELTKKEFELLVFLIVNKNRVLSKQSIAEHLWGDYMDLLDSHDFVYQHVKNLRKKITQAGGNDYIKTMYGSGYKFTN